MISIIAVIGKHRELGEKNHLLWHVPGDLPRFRKLTTGHPVIMGRKTFQSIGRPLPERTNIVISRDPDFKAQGVTVVSSFEDAVRTASTAPGSDELFVIGGGQIYAQAIGKADRLYLTVVDAQADSADTFFPDFSAFTDVNPGEVHEAEGMRFTYRLLSR